MPRRDDTRWRNDESPSSTYLPPRRSLPTQPRTSSVTPLDYIPPHRSDNRTASRSCNDDEDEEYLSADAATRIMMEKWDLLDSTVTPNASSGHSQTREGRRRQRPTRSNSVPSTGSGRRKSRVREWEDWKPEMERIRLAQVEMEERLDREAKEHQLASMEKDRRHEKQAKVEKGKKKSRDRKSTPRYPTFKPDEEEDSQERRLLSPESNRAVSEESEVETRTRRRGSRYRQSEEAAESVEPLSRPVSRRSRHPAEPTSRASTRKPHSTAQINTREPARTVSAPLPSSSNTSSRSSRRKPRPPLEAPPVSSTTPAAPAPARRSRSSRNRPRPSSSPPLVDARPKKSTPSPTPEIATENDLLATATHAAEQVSEAVTNAFTKVIPGLFGIKK